MVEEKKEKKMAKRSFYIERDANILNGQDFVSKFRVFSYFKTEVKKYGEVGFEHISLHCTTKDEADKILEGFMAEYEKREKAMFEELKKKYEKE